MTNTFVLEMIKLVLAFAMVSNLQDLDLTLLTLCTSDGEYALDDFACFSAKRILRLKEASLTNHSVWVCCRHIEPIPALKLTENTSFKLGSLIVSKFFAFVILMVSTPSLSGQTFSAPGHLAETPSSCACLKSLLEDSVCAVVITQFTI